jgi:hypothetical protein
MNFFLFLVSMSISFFTGYLLVLGDTRDSLVAAHELLSAHIALTEVQLTNYELQMATLEEKDTHNRLQIAKQTERLTQMLEVCARAREDCAYAALEIASKPPCPVLQWASISSGGEPSAPSK